MGHEIIITDPTDWIEIEREVDVNGTIYRNIDIGELGEHDFEICAWEAYSNDQIEVDINFGPMTIPFESFVAEVRSQELLHELMEEIGSLWEDDEIINAVIGERGESCL